MSNKFSQEKDFRVCAARLSTIPMKKLIPRNCVTWLPLQRESCQLSCLLLARSADTAAAAVMQADYGPTRHQYRMRPPAQRTLPPGAVLLAKLPVICFDWTF